MSQRQTKTPNTRKPFRRSALAAGGFTVAYLLVAAAAALFSGNREFALYIAVMVVLGAVVVAVHWRVNFSAGLLWGLSAWGLAHMAGGLVPVPPSWPVHGPNRVLYSLWLIPGVLKYDHIVHAYGFGVTTWVCWQGLLAVLHRGPLSEAAVQPTWGMLTLCAAASLGFGALNEVIEFAATQLIPGTNVGGYENTGWDLVANLAGALIAAGMIRFGYKDHRGITA